MAKAWKDVIQSDSYKALSPKAKLEAQEQYFRDVVTPKLQPEDIPAAKKQFYDAYPPDPNAISDKDLRELTHTVTTPYQPPQMPEGFGKADPNVGWGDTIVSGMNRGITNILGFPGDIAAMAGTGLANLIGKPEWGGPLPVGGEGIRSGLEAAGIDTSSFQRGTGSQQFVGRIFQELGETAPVVGGAARLARGGLKTVRPTREGAAALGAGTGAATAQVLFPDNPLAEAIGSIGGGLSTDAAISLAGAMPTLGKHVFDSFFPTTKGKVRQATGQALRSGASTNPYVERNLARTNELASQYPGFNPNTGQATGDPFLIQETRKARSRDTQLASELYDNNLHNNRLISSVLRDIAPDGNPEDIKRVLDDITRTRRAELDSVAARVEADTGRAVADMTPVTTRQQRGETVRGVARRGRRAWKDQAAEDFGAIPKATRINADPLKEVAERVISEGQQDAAIIPNVAHELAKGDDAVPIGLVDARGEPLMADPPKEVTFDYLRQKRTQINREIQQASNATQPNEQYIRNLRRLNTAIEDTLDEWAKSGNSAAHRQYREARARYREGAEKYKEGVTGQLFWRDRTGADRIADSDVLDSYFSVGRAGPERAQEFKSVYGNDPDAMAAMSDHIVGKLTNLAIDGKVKPEVIRKFQHQYRDALAEFPDARARINQFLEARRIGAQTMERVGRSRAQIEKDIAALYLDADPEKILSRALSGQNPREKLGRLVRMVSRNPEAKAGLRRAFMDYMEGKIVSKSQGLAGEEFLMPNQMRAFLKNNRDFLEKLYTRQELKTLDDVLDMASIIGRDMKDPFPGGSDTAAKMTTGQLSMSSLMSRLYAHERGIIGTRWMLSELGARIGGSIFKSVNEDEARKVLSEALTNPQFARDLMAKAGTAEGKKAAGRLRAYLVTAGIVDQPGEAPQE